MQRFETPHPISVDVDVVAGSVHAIASERSDTTVVVNPRDPSEKADVEAVERTTVDMAGRKLVVKTPKRGIGSLVGLTKPGFVDVTIELPEKSSLELTTGMGDVNANGVFGDATVKSGAGAIHIDQAAAVQLKSGAGSLSVNHCRGDAQATTAGEMSIGHIGGGAEIKNLNGKTRIGEVGGGISVTSANGDIGIDRARSHVSARTANGSIVVGEVGSGEVSLESASGGLEVGIEQGAVAWLDVSTKFGRVHNSLEATGSPDEARGRVAVRARTSFGDIQIHRSPSNEETGEK
ncbi:MAG TPA: DUF4097 family beta strand repeat-containing protein [Acidimicrobiia bacterium]|nr:DUF4097 family beta strand repeat-containing protein [Acidimicrobiia bacterium]